MSENKIQKLKKLVDEHFNNIEYLTLQINESEIAIVCHCNPNNIEKNHEQLFYININNDKNKYKIGKNINYVDESCPDDSWTKITNNSLMYIWGIHCPIYMSYEMDSVIKNILTNSFEKLKIKGKVLFGFNCRSIKTDLKKQITDNNNYLRENKDCYPGFDFKIVPIKDLSYELSNIIGKEFIIGNEFIIGKEFIIGNEICDNYYVFTKIIN
jgi:hypothetical protein